MRRVTQPDVTPSLFDEPVTAESDTVVTDLVVEKGNSEELDDLDDWEEVPQARFLSWSHAHQLHYCWRRDLDAALRAEKTSDAQFFLDRAASYKALYDESVKPADDHS